MVVRFSVRAQVVCQAMAWALALYLVVASLLSVPRWRAFLRSTDPGKRERRYRVSLWLQAATVAVALIAADRHALSLHMPERLEWAMLGGVTFVVVVSGALLVWTQLGRRIRDRALATIQEILPRTPRERRWFALLLTLAGPTEEVVYRGFFLAFLTSHGVSSWPLLIGINAALFGVGHFYQGVRGMILTGLAGALFAGMTLESGSLFAPIVLHTLIDLRALWLVLSKREATS